MAEQKRPADSELMFAAGLLAGSRNHLNGLVAQEQVKHVVDWLIYLVEEEETIENLKKRGITPVVYEKPDEER